MLTDKFIKTITHSYGEAGVTWLSQLVKIIKELQLHWNLKEITPVQSMSFNFVAKSIQEPKTPVVLKICCGRHVFESEAKALSFFQGQGSVQLLDRNDKHNALLLEQAIPGVTLKDLYPTHLDLVYDGYIRCMKTLHDRPCPTSFPHLSHWLDDLDKNHPTNLPKDLIDKAIDLKNKLLKTASHHKLLHGDLHLDNLVSHGNVWLAIDPKGIIGEPEFEIAAFDFISEQELFNATRELLLDRIKQVSDKAGLSAQRVKEWTFVRLILSAIWSIEDQEDCSKAIKIASLLK